MKTKNLTNEELSEINLIGDRISAFNDRLQILKKELKDNPSREVDSLLSTLVIQWQNYKKLHNPRLIYLREKLALLQWNAMVRSTLLREWGGYMIPVFNTRLE